MPPRPSRGAGPQKGQQQQQAQQPPPQQQQQQGPPPPPHNLHNFHQPQPQYGGSTNSTNSNNSSAQPYLGVGGGSPDRYGNPPPTGPPHHQHHQHQHQHHQHHQHQQPPGGWGAGGANNHNSTNSYGGGQGSNNTSMYGGNPPPPPQQQQMQMQPPYGSEMDYGQNSVHSTPYPQQPQQQQHQPGSANNRGPQQQLPPQQQRRTPGPSQPTPSYYNTNNNHNGNQGAMPPPPHQQQGGYRGVPGGHAPHMEPSPSFAGNYGGGDGTNSPPPPSPGFRGGGSASRGPVGVSANNMGYGGGAGSYPPPPQQQGQASMPPPPPPDGYGANSGPMPPQQQQPPPQQQPPRGPHQHHHHQHQHQHPHQHQHQQHGMYGGPMVPPGQQPPPQQWAGGYGGPVPPPGQQQPPPQQPMGMGQPDGMMPPPQQQPQPQPPMAPPPQQPQQPQQQQPMPSGRGRGGSTGGLRGRGGSNNNANNQMQQQQQQVPPPQQPQQPQPQPQAQPPQQQQQPGLPMNGSMSSMHQHPHQHHLQHHLQHRHQHQHQPPPAQMMQAPPPPPMAHHMQQPPPPGMHVMAGPPPPGQMYNQLPPSGMVGMPGVQGAMMPPPPGMQGQPLMPQFDNTASDPVIEQGFFYDFLKNRRLLKADSLSAFMPRDYDPKRGAPVKVVVDGNYMVNNLRGRMEGKDPLWFLHSVLPDMLLEMVHLEVTKMRAHNLEPVWVFQGIGTSGDVEAFLPSKDELQARDDVWHTLTDGDLPSQSTITTAFDASSSIGSDVLMAIQRFLLTELGVLAVTAPFLNWCQMAALHHEGDAYLMMGPPEMLIVPYDKMKLIVEMDLDHDQVAYFDREEVVRDLFPAYDLRSAGDRLLDFGLLVATQSPLSTSRAQMGLSGEEIYEELSSPQPHYPSLKLFINSREPVDPSRRGEPGREGAQALKHAKGRTYVTCSAVFCKTVPDTPLIYFKRLMDRSLTNRNMANNLSGVFGNYLPLSFFYFQYIGLLSVDLMTIVAQSYFRDEMPVSDSRNYQNYLPRLVALRSQTLFQIMQRLNQSHRSRLEKVSWVRWFQSVLVVVTTPMETITLDEWDLSNTDEAVEEVKRMELEDVSIATILSMQGSVHCQPEELQNSTVGRDAQQLYHGPKETFLAIMLKSFDFLGYFSHNTPDDEGEVYDEDGVPLRGDGGFGINNSGGATLIDVENDRHVDLHQQQQQQSPKDAVGLESDSVVNPSTAFLIRTLQACPPQFHAAIIRLAEMSRIKLLDASPCVYMLPVEGAEETEDMEDSEDSPDVLLASRIACLLSIPYLDNASLEEDREFEWAPVYCRNLCTFSVIVRAMNRDLRELVEVIAAAVFISGHSDVSLDVFASFIQYLPFGDIPSTIGGLLLHYVLVFPEDYESNRNTPQERCEYLQEKFCNIPDVAGQLRSVMTFVIQALYFLNAFRTNDDEDNKLALELLQIGSTDEAMDIIDETLKLMHIKWGYHLEGAPPTDVHGLWPLRGR